MYKKVDLPSISFPLKLKDKIPSKADGSTCSILHDKLFTQLMKADSKAPAAQLLEAGLLSQMHYFDGHFFVLPTNEGSIFTSCFALTPRYWNTLLNMRKYWTVTGFNFPGNYSLKMWHCRFRNKGANGPNSGLSSDKMYPSEVRVIFSINLKKVDISHGTQQEFVPAQKGKSNLKSEVLHSLSFKTKLQNVRKANSARASVRKKPPVNHSNLPNCQI